MFNLEKKCSPTLASLQYIRNKKYHKISSKKLNGLQINFLTHKALLNDIINFREIRSGIVLNVKYLNDYENVIFLKCTYLVMLIGRVIMTNK